MRLAIDPVGLVSSFRAVSPYAQIWSLLQLPHVLVALTWLLVPARLPRLGALVLLGWLGIQAAAVLSGDLPTERPVVPGLVETLVLGAACFRRPAHRFALRSTAGAIAAFALGQVLPAVVLLGRGALEQASAREGVGFGVVLLAIGLRDHASLQVAEAVGILGFGMDTTTVLAHLVLGLLSACGWWFLLGLKVPSPS